MLSGWGKQTSTAYGAEPCEFEAGKAYCVDEAANGVWLTDHVPPGYLSGWPG